MPFQSSFASQLYHARTKKGLTQAQVAEMADISVRWYQQLEKGAYPPGTITMLRLIFILDIDIQAFREEVGLYEKIPV